MTTTEIAPRGALPNLFVAGAPKAGTTSLCRSLSAHPDIYLPHLKEPQFFGSDRRSAVAGRKGYEALFAPGRDARWRLDGSVLTLSSRDAIDQILDLVPDARFVCVLRDPVEAVPAFYDQLRRHFAEPSPRFELAWRAQEARAAGRAPGPVYSEYFDYARQLDALRSKVPADRRRVYSFEMLRREGPWVLADLQSFLGLEATPLPMLHENENRVPRSRAVHGLKHVLSHGAGRAKRALGVDRNFGLGSLLFAPNARARARAPLSAELRASLLARFEADRSALAAETCRTPRLVRP